MTGVTTRSIDAGDGRALCVEIAGEGERTIFVHGGTPNSRHLFAPWCQDAAARGARLVSYDRPGYGGSTPRPGRTVADAAADTRAIADALGLERFAVWGYSGGGPAALACSALLGDRVSAVATVGAIAPWGMDDLDYFAGMGQSNVDDIQLYLSDPAASRRRGAEERAEMLAATPQELMGVLESLLSPVDVAALSGPLAEWMVACTRDGLAPGDEGWWEDGVADMAAWSFELSSIAIPVKIWHGAQDRFVPIQHGRWLAAHIPGAEAALTEDNGHLSLLTGSVPTVHEWLLGHA